RDCKPCRLASAGIPCQSRAYRRAGVDQPHRGRNCLSSARPSLPPARQARRRLETVLARHARDRARPDPAHCLCGRTCRALPDRLRGGGLGGTAFRAMVCGRVTRQEKSEETKMSKSTPAIKSVKARAVVTPMARPVKNAFGVIDVAPLLLIDVATDQGITGRSYLFAYSKVTLKPFVHLIEEIGRELVGKAV